MSSKIKRSFEFFFKLNVIVVSALVCLVAINSSYKFEFKNLPEENFVNVMITKHLVELAEDCEHDTGAECHAESFLMQGVASGLAFKSDGDSSYILTADHFCNPMEFSDESLSTDLWITTSHGVSWEAELVYSDYSSDLCILKSKMPIDREIVIANSMPKIGENVYAISAPHGFQESGVSFHFTGAFSGCSNLGNCFFTIPSATGSSGSLIIDKRGEIVGMIQMTIIGFENISIGSGVSSIRLFLEEASVETGIQF